MTRPGRKASSALGLAQLAGATTYDGGVHKKCGTTERYVKGGACVHCAREKQHDLRAAVRELNHGQGFDLTTEVVSDTDDPLKF